MTRRYFTKALFIVLGLVAAGVLAGSGVAARAAVRHYQGQTVYVPVYSYIYYGNKPHKINLTATLSVRNTSLAHPIRIMAVRYVDSHGKTVREYVTQPVELASLGRPATPCPNPTWPAE
jgi:hypothetical protein